MQDISFRKPAVVLRLWGGILLLVFLAGTAANTALAVRIRGIRERDPWMYWNAASVFLERNDVAGALSQMREGMAKVPDEKSAILHVQTGDILYSIRNWQEALEAYQGAIDRGDRSYHVRQRLIWVYVGLQRLDELAAFCEECLDEGFSSPSFLRHAAQGLHRAGRLDRAIQLYEQALEGYPNDILLLELLMQAYTAQGNTEKTEALSARIAAAQAG